MIQSTLEIGDIHMKIIDLNTLEVRSIRSTEVQKRVLKRAGKLYRKARDMKIPGVSLAYFVGYSWKLENGHIWT